jgi:hypothetical protein
MYSKQYSGPYVDLPTVAWPTLPINRSHMPVVGMSVCHIPKFWNVKINKIETMFTCLD